MSATVPARESVEGFGRRRLYAPPSRFAYSSSIRSSYNLSAARSSSVFSECVTEATAWVAGFSTSRAVCAEAEVLCVVVDLSVVAGIGTGILKDVRFLKGSSLRLGFSSVEVQGWRERCWLGFVQRGCYIRGTYVICLWGCTCVAELEASVCTIALRRSLRVNLGTLPNKNHTSTGRLCSRA
ncbi:hypothetical protein K458DRAFT_406013 [Lentithecium fluviatile CBS 122367]|uniref:Uncharacterized protein n=1 Tax=Lentithecium fluviatile CBS 122367 TaxID=1168545 RepID=A0A6G1IVJ8_9PLEO|nr:hypothetical protein K458DRAFT_406013 [Lentithecium fluviatile CBS 122367]